MWQASRIVVFLLLCFERSSVNVCTADATGKRCPPVKGRESETCVCQSDKGIIDLTSLSGTDGKPRFSGLSDGNDYLYSYNPCKTYSIGTDSPCKDVQICQALETDPTRMYAITTAGTEQMWIESDGTVYLFYTGPADVGNREAKVFLKCDGKAKNPIATTVGDSPPREVLHYEFNITAAAACPKGSGGSVAGPVGLVLISLCIIGLIVYFIVGALFMKFYYNASGTDIIPNKNIWLQFPFLIKDGFIFTFGPCYRFIEEKRRGSQGYQKA